MTRLEPASFEQYEPVFGADADIYLQVLAHRPVTAAAFKEFTKVMYADRCLPPRLYEVVRLRIAFWNQCRSCMAMRYEDATADGLTEELVCSLERPEEAEDLTPAERAAIAFADQMATDHHSVDEGSYQKLREHFSEAEIVDLCLEIAIFVGMGRMAATWNMVEDLPQHYRKQDQVTPWGAGDGEIKPMQRRAPSKQAATR